jgi:hypothetical protein
MYIWTTDERLIYLEELHALQAVKDSAPVGTTVVAIKETAGTAEND